MTTDKRTSEQGNVFSVAIIREFLLAALSHDAVTDAVDAMLFEHVVEGRLHPSVITENLRPLITEVLETATLEDWQYVSDTLCEEACEVLRPDTTSDPSHRTAKRTPDPGEMREELGQLYTEDLLSPSKYRRARLLIRKISRLTGCNRDTVLANARADAEAIRASDEYDAGRASRSSGQTPASGDPAEVIIDAGTPPIVAARQVLRHVMDNGGAVYIEDTKGNEVEGWVTGLTEDEVSIQDAHGGGQATYIRLTEIETLTETEIFVRQVSRDEALVLLDRIEGTGPLVRKRVAVLLASSVGCTVNQIVTAQKVEESFVRKVITDFNECGLESLESSTPTTITLDNGQFNLLISGLGLARLALNGCGDEYVGFAKDYHRLADEIVAQLPGDGPAPRAARERLAIQERRATSTRRSS